jgi:hypothetical protein
MKLKTLLYNSVEVRQAIVQLFRSSKGRRVAISAFVGQDAEAYLPKPKGLQLICWPKAGGTNPNGLRKLVKRGVDVFFADGLHMKVYWSEDKGAVLTSANLSTNALGSGNLKEIGVFLEPGEINVDRLIQSLKIRPISSKELKRLDKYHKQYVARNKGGDRMGRHVVSFGEWYELPFRSEWKLGWFEGTVELSSNARAISESEYGVQEPENWLSCRSGDYKKNDWILTFKLKKSPTELGWMFVNYVAKVPRSDKKAYSRECPCQAVQVWKKRIYPAPPFSERSKRFQRAFSKGVFEFGLSRIKELKSCKPPKPLVDLVYKYFKAS